MNFKEKFKNKTVVQPLYKKPITKKVLQLDGHGIEVRRQFDLSKSDKVNIVNVKEKVIKINNDKQMFADISGGCGDLRQNMPKFVRDTWLRVYPLAKLPDESSCSVIFRCLVCQLGIATFLTLWTVIWVFAIQAFEGPYEIEVSVEFENKQNQLVIDLATELRQITPISPKWRDAIERRMQDERQLTISAIGRGARIHPGRFWDLPGTFLFTVYVMTALGFGAPVPQTLLGRSCALIYAVLAVPLHIYLMVNLSTCLVVNVSLWLKGREMQNKAYNSDRNREIRKESANCSRNSELIKTSNLSKIRKKLTSITSVLTTCQCMPFTILVYYVAGAIIFGVLRNRPAVDVFMFPLEFTTTGGLEQVESHVRVFYGLYVGGAMVLLSCVLATLRHQSSSKMHHIAEKYRLFHENV